MKKCIIFILILSWMFLPTPPLYAENPVNPRYSMPYFDIQTRAFDQSEPYTFASFFLTDNKD